VAADAAVVEPEVELAALFETDCENACCKLANYDCADERLPDCND